MKSFIISFGFLFLLVSCAQTQHDDLLIPVAIKGKPSANEAVATFAEGCFWHSEIVFQSLAGVRDAVSGYAGGKDSNPDYEKVSTGETGHAECVQIVYDSSKISFDELLEVFWQVHDPTTLNRQGNDVGTQYRSVIFYHSPEQKEKAEHYKAALNDSGVFDKPIVTAIEPYTNFYSAEDYHQKYFDYNRGQMYCRLVIAPKIEKFEKVFKNKLKSAAKNGEMAENRN